MLFTEISLKKDCLTEIFSLDVVAIRFLYGSLATSGMIHVPSQITAETSAVRTTAKLENPSFVLFSRVNDPWTNAQWHSVRLSGACYTAAEWLVTLFGQKREPRLLCQEAVFGVRPASTCHNFKQYIICQPYQILTNTFAVDFSALRR